MMVKEWIGRWPSEALSQLNSTAGRSRQWKRICSPKLAAGLDSGAVAGGEPQRIFTLDVLRGFALFGILVLNVQIYAVPESIMFTMEEKYVDVGRLGEALGLLSGLLEKKMMGLFSLLFGISTLLITDGAARKGLTPALIYYRRIVALFLIGIGHAGIWWGDVLSVYGFCAFPLYFFRRLPAIWLMALGVFFFCALGPVCGLLWEAGGSPYSHEDILSRAIGMMFLGMATYRWQIVTGEQSLQYYWGMTIAGFGVGGLQLIAPAGTVVGLVAVLASVVGFVGLVILATRAKWLDGLCAWLAAVGRMAFTNYLMHTVIGFSLASGEMMPDEQMVVFLGVMMVQLVLSPLWLRKFHYGPAEWLWRWVTYWRIPPFKKINE